MSSTDRDRRIRAALTPAEDVHAPPGLADDILRLASAQPQARPRMLVGASWGRSRAVLILLALLLAAMAMAAATLLRPTDRSPARVTTLYGGDGRTGVMAGPLPEGTPVEAWRADLSGSLLWLHQPLIGDGTAFVVDSRGGVFALDLADGMPRWTARVGRVAGTPVLVGGLLVVAEEDGLVSAFDARDGTLRWTRELGVATHASLGAAGGLVLVGATDGTLRALAVASGEPAWSSPIGGSVTRAPAIADGMVFVGADGGHVRALDLATGARRWELELGPFGVATPVVDGGTVYLTTGDEDGPEPYRVRAIEASSGAERWTWVAPTVGRINSGGVADGAIFAPSNAGLLYRIDAETGQGAPFIRVDGAVPSTPAWVDGTLVLAIEGGRLVAVDAVTAEVTWSVPVAGDPTTPAVADGTILVGTSQGKLIAWEGADAGS